MFLYTVTSVLIIAIDIQITFHILSQMSDSGMKAIQNYYKTSQMSDSGTSNRSRIFCLSTCDSCLTQLIYK